MAWYGKDHYTPDGTLCTFILIKGFRDAVYLFANACTTLRYRDIVLEKQEQYFRSVIAGFRILCIAWTAGALALIRPGLAQRMEPGKAEAATTSCGGGDRITR